MAAPVPEAHGANQTARRSGSAHRRAGSTTDVTDERLTFPEPDLNQPRHPEAVTEPMRGDTGRVGDTDADPRRRDLRAEIGQYVSLMKLPTTTGKLAREAADHDAPQHVVSALRGVPDDLKVKTVHDLWIVLHLEGDQRF